MIAAADRLREDWGVVADIWATPGINGLTREGQDTARWNLLHPTEPPRQSYVETCLADHPGPVVAATDYMKLYAEQIRPLHTAPLSGARYGWLRTQRHSCQAAPAFRGGSVLRDGDRAQGTGRRWESSVAKVAEAIAKYAINPEKPNPLTV